MNSCIYITPYWNINHCLIKYLLANLYENETIYCVKCKPFLLKCCDLDQTECSSGADIHLTIDVTSW